MTLVDDRPLVDNGTLIDEPPEKLSDLIRLAVRDARGLDRTLYRPASFVWHDPDTDIELGLQCRVCLAGAVIAGTLNVAPEDEASPTLIRLRHGWVPGLASESRWPEALLALDRVREGVYIGAVTTHYDVEPTQEESKALVRIPHPDHNDFRGWVEFDKHLVSLLDRADQLEKLGF